MIGMRFCCILVALSFTLTVLDYEYKEDIDSYLADLKETKVKNLQELVDWNLAHAEEALPAGTWTMSTCEEKETLIINQNIPVKSSSRTP
jgi:hypothetical protein